MRGGIVRGPLGVNAGFLRIFVLPIQWKNDMLRQKKGVNAVGFGFDFMFNIFPVFFCIMFVIVIGTFVVVFVKGISQWNKNNHSPRLTVPATVVSKRADISSRRHDGHTHRSTSYFVTFQVESGDRMELQLQGHEYGLIVEGDRGNLSFQGTRYLGFERT